MRRKLRNIYNILQSECSIIPLISIIKGDFENHFGTICCLFYYSIRMNKVGRGLFLSYKLKFHFSHYTRVSGSTS